MKPDDWPPDALTLLDTLWGLRMQTRRIRATLVSRCGIYPTFPEIKAAATRYLATPDKPVAAFLPLGAPQTVPQVQTLPTPARKPTDNVVRRVAPGTHKASGFSMLGGRLHG